jgi:hypothetical protein
MKMTEKSHRNRKNTHENVKIQIKTTRNPETIRKHCKLFLDSNSRDKQITNTIGQNSSKTHKKRIKMTAKRPRTRKSAYKTAKIAIKPPTPPARRSHSKQIKKHNSPDFNYTRLQPQIGQISQISSKTALKQLKNSSKTHQNDRKTALIPEIYI